MTGLMSVEDRLVTHQKLTDAIVAACLEALSAGFSHSDVHAVLTRVVELIEAEGTDD